MLMKNHINDLSCDIKIISDLIDSNVRKNRENTPDQKPANIDF